MLELSPARKNKVSLSDYNSEQDIQSRMLMADFSSVDLKVLEEILYSPLKILSRKLARATELSDSTIIEILHKLAKVGLVSEQPDGWIVDKEMRKYFEFQIQRFDPAFKPDMEFIQALLKKAPIHVLPTWYAIPRSSNSIFESIVEKFLATPASFLRYLQELNFGDPRIHGMVQDILGAPDLRIASNDLIVKYNLSRHDFEEIMLLLEFSFVSCVRYVKEEDHFVEIVTPFFEWQEYLRFLKETQCTSIPSSQKVVPLNEKGFWFIEEAASLLKKAKKKGLSLSSIPPEQTHLVQKLCLVKLAEDQKGKIVPTVGAADWLEMSLENRALYLYRHPHNQILSTPLSSSIASDRNIREAEKTIRRANLLDWVLFDDFFRGMTLSFHEDAPLSLQRIGKQWKYAIPQYNEEEKRLTHAVLFELLFECGMLIKGVCNGNDCFQVTPFGRFFFGE